MDGAEPGQGHSHTVQSSSGNGHDSLSFGELPVRLKVKIATLGATELHVLHTEYSAVRCAFHGLAVCSCQK